MVLFVEGDGYNIIMTVLTPGKVIHDCSNTGLVAMIEFTELKL